MATNLKRLNPLFAFGAPGPRTALAASSLPPELVTARDVAPGWSPVENLLGLQIPHRCFHFLRLSNPPLILPCLHGSRCLPPRPL